jgi:hypothetical protein
MGLVSFSGKNDSQFFPRTPDNCPMFAAEICIHLDVTSELLNIIPMQMGSSGSVVG